MNYRNQINSIINFLSKYEPIWNYEVLQQYPNSLAGFKQEWIDNLESLSNEELFDIDCGHYKKVDNLHPELKELFTSITNLSSVPFHESASDHKYPDFAFWKVGEKKKHEITKVVSLVDSFLKESQCDKLIDIGGGQGHMARTFSQFHDIETFSIDRDKSFQESGKIRLQKYPEPVGSRPMHFVSLEFNENDEQVKKLFSHNSFSIGLHTCGPLANSHLKASIQNSTLGLLNFGCCYNRMDPKKDFPQSNYLKNDTPVKISYHAFSLATRGHFEISAKEFKQKIRVKEYRYAFHMFLKDNNILQEFLAIGSSLHREYQLDFYSWAKLKCEQNNIVQSFSEQVWNNYFEQAKTYIRKMFLADLIRWQFGRLIELILILDRAIYLEENHYSTSVLEVFDRKLSPRNIGIFAKKKPAN